MQLKHDPEETSRDGHGWVRVSFEGKELAFEEGVQHNRGYSGRKATLAKMAEAVGAAMKGLPAAAAAS